jgi:hypothetical protein
MAVLTWQFVICWQLENQMVTRGMMWVNYMRTRGPIGGCHASLTVWLCRYGLLVQNFGGRGVRPHDLSSMQRFHNVTLTVLPPSDSYYVYGFEII